MSVLSTQRITVDEFLVSAEGVAGRPELYDGTIFKKPPQAIRIARARMAAFVALKRAGELARLDCETLPSGVAIRISRDTAYVPDAIIYGGPRLDGDAMEVPNPIVLVEVIPEPRGGIDTQIKLSDYFKLPTVHHYLIVDALRRIVVHHARGEGEVILTRILTAGALTLDPPGIEFDVESMFPKK
jgi:Uma2 family endonuclease